MAGTTYVAIFDIGSKGNNVLFASEKYDKSDSVLRKLGIRPDKEGEPGNTRGDEEEQPDRQPDDGGAQPQRDGGSSPDRGGGENTIKPPR